MKDIFGENHRVNIAHQMKSNLTHLSDIGGKSPKYP